METKSCKIPIPIAIREVHIWSNRADTAEQFWAGRRQYITTMPTAMAGLLKNEMKYARNRSMGELMRDLIAWGLADRLKKRMQIEQPNHKLFRVQNIAEQLHKERREKERDDAMNVLFDCPQELIEKLEIERGNRGLPSRRRAIVEILQEALKDIDIPVPQEAEIQDPA